MRPLRMAGFTIRKAAGRKSALVRLLEAGWRLCRKAAQLLQALRKKADAERELEAKVRRGWQEREAEEEQRRVAAMGSGGVRRRRSR